MNEHPVTRRRFISQLSAAAAALTLLPRPLRAAPAGPGRRLGIVLVGLGNYSENHLAPAIRESKYWKLAGVVTGDAAKGRRWAREHGFPATNIWHYDTMNRIAGHPEVEVVYVVTPNGLHAAHAIAAARAGKHVICEKPMANTVEECDAIIAACDKARVELFLGYRLHYEPHHVAFAEIGRSQEFGPFQRMKGANGFRMGDGHGWRLNAKLAGGGPLMDMGVYVIQAACMAKAEAAPVAITAKFGPVERPEIFKEVEESVSWTAEFADGSTAECLATYAKNVSYLRAEAARGWAQVDSFYYEGQRLTTSAGERKYPPVNHQLVQMDGIAGSLLEGKPNIVPGSMGRRDLTIVEAIYASARAGGQRVAVRA